MPSTTLVRPHAGEPLDLDEVLRRFPKQRQSDLSHFDDCELSSLFSLRYENGWSTHPQARGTIEHRAIAECIRTMQAQDSEAIPVGEALAILEEVCYQHGVPAHERVRVPLREMDDIEMAIIKFANDNSFSVRDIHGVERRLDCEVPYRTEHGEIVKRAVTGQIDLLVMRGLDEAVVVDWKGTWALPPRHEEDDKKPGLSYHGYFQQLFYGVLVMENFPAIMAVVLREFYHRRTAARPARMTRQDLPRARERLAKLVHAFDAAIAAGEPPKLTLDALDAHGYWKPSPGHHCGYCAKASLCPIDDDYKGDGGIRTPEEAARAAGWRQRFRAVDKHLTEHLKVWCELHGPIPIKRAKGRRVLGHRKIKGGTRFEEYTPESSDRPSTEETYNPNLKAAMQDSVAQARKERGSS